MQEWTRTHVDTIKHTQIEINLEIYVIILEIYLEIYVIFETLVVHQR